MQTLKEISFAAAVKFGVGPWGEGELPAELKEELEERHFKIQMATTERYHFHRGSLNTEDIQIFWDRRNNMENGEQWVGFTINHEDVKEEAKYVLKKKVNLSKLILILVIP